VRHALASDDVRIVRAHMRPDGAASMRVLERCGFERIGEVIDAEDGLVIRWEIRKCAPPH
jgi:[ribosomal protein S5]-alanine N-acetyltransferase